MKLLKNKLSPFTSHLSTSKGFTLVELLVVIAVLAVLAAIILLAVNPAEQLARGRDSSRVSAVTQLGRTLQAYFTAQGAVYPPVPASGNDWMQPLIQTTDLKTRVGNAAYSVSPDFICTGIRVQTGGGVINGTSGFGYCYHTALVGSPAVPEAVVYVQMEAAINLKKCETNANDAWYVFSTANGRAGTVCGAEPVAGTVTFVGNP